MAGRTGGGGGGGLPCCAVGPGGLVSRALGGYPAPLASGLREGARAVQAVSLSFPPSRKMATNFLVHEKIWFDKFKYDDAERKFYEQMNGPLTGSSRQVRAVRGARVALPQVPEVGSGGSWLLLGCGVCSGLSTRRPGAEATEAGLWHLAHRAAPLSFRPARRFLVLRRRDIGFLCFLKL